MAKRFVPAPLVHPPPFFSSPSSFPPAALLDHPSSSFPISGVNTDFDVELTNLMNRHLHCLPGICFLLWVVLATRPNGINGRPNKLYGKKRRRSPCGCCALVERKWRAGEEGDSCCSNEDIITRDQQTSTRRLRRWSQLKTPHLFKYYTFLSLYFY